VFLELVGGAYVAENLACAAGRARIVIVGLVAGARGDIDLGAILRKRLTVIGTVLRARALAEKIEVTTTFAREIVPRVARGELRPVIDRVLPLEKSAEAHAYVESNEGFGKVVLEV
jgi:NADPH:quinone reductase-like Zn-dependent oxidoreductase